MPVFEKFYRRLRSQELESAEQEFLRSINLIHFTTLSEIAAGMELILGTVSQKLFEDLKEILFGRRAPCDVIEITARVNQPAFQPRLSDYDSLIPQSGVP
jgi:hypothetical protein